MMVPSNSQSAVSYFGRPMFLLLSFVIAVSLGCGQSASEKNMSQLNSIAGTLKQSGPSPAVVAQLNTYLENYPQDDLAWTTLGNCQIELEDFPSASNAFETALKINPRLVEAITGQGILLRYQGQYAESLAMYQRALEIDPNYAQAYSSMVAIAILRKDYAKAVEYGQHSYQLDSTDPLIAANLALAYHHLGDVANRDKFKNVAAQLNYKDMDSLQQIINGDIKSGQ